MMSVAVFMQDPSVDGAEAKVAILMDASTRLDQLDDPDKMVEEMGISQRQWGLMTCLGALERMANSGPFLKRYLEDKRETPRRMAVIALARQGNAEVHDDVVALMGQGQDDYWRMAAANAFKKVATKEDVPMLTVLAQADPYLRISDTCRGVVSSYPVREAASEVLKKLGE
jgi:hypothetical protein